MFYFVKTPLLLKKFYPTRVWDIQTNEKIIYLTFDDGPHPDATPIVLAELKKYSAHATFFCIGKNVKKYFDIYKNVVSDGHRTGNHTFDHLNGWEVEDGKYIQNIEKAAELIDSNLFRPPYGRISRFQLKVIGGAKFKLKTIMWTVLSGDFDEKLTGENCYRNVVKNAGPGSIIVFHDSMKALPRLSYALPRVLDYFSSKGYQFRSIDL